MSGEAAAAAGGLLLAWALPLRSPQTAPLRLPKLINRKLRPTGANHRRSNKATVVFAASTQGRPASAYQAVHFVGIGGVGLSALARLALSKGCRVSGSDATDSKILQQLQKEGAVVHIGHSPLQLTGEKGLPDAVVVTSAVRGTNLEILAAKALGIPVFKRNDWLKVVTADYELLAVAGTHGKTTTSAMLSVALLELGESITALLGGEVSQFPNDGNFVAGKSSTFVIEADEYDGAFLGLSPSLAIITNVELDHVDLFPTQQAVDSLFTAFAQRVRSGGTLILCDENPGSARLRTVFDNDPILQAIDLELGQMSTSEDALDDGMLATIKKPPVRLASHRSVVTYGLKRSSDWQAVNINPNPEGGTDYTAVWKRRPIGRVRLQVPGLHNVLNSLAVIAAVSLLASEKALREAWLKGEDPEVADELAAHTITERAKDCARALYVFSGVARRFEIKDNNAFCTIIDDYAHHPTEVQALLQGARQRFPDRPLWVVFQPHTFSRLAQFLQEFAASFSGANRLVVSKVYAAREKDVYGISGQDLVRAVSDPPALYIPDQDDITQRLVTDLKWESSVPENPRPVVITVGAGDITLLGPKLKAALADTVQQQ
eukprot:jgi/Chlat1/4662/Chrsp3S00439